MKHLTYPAALSFIVVLLFGGVPLLAPSQPAIAWIASAVLLVAFVAVAGYSITGCWSGALIDERNVVSLSRFQMALWTCLVLSAFLTAALINLPLDNTVNHGATLNIDVPPELWALMGISTTSLVASPLILATKATKPANVAETQATTAVLSKQDPDIGTDNKGQLIVNKTNTSARWSDMFTGEEVGNAAHLDLARVQMFFFTIVTALAYAGALVYLFWTMKEGGIHKLPPLDKTMVTLIGISHGGYLTSKAIPHSQDAA